MGWGDPLHLRIWARRESESGLELLGAGGFVQPEMEGGTFRSCESAAST